MNITSSHMATHLISDLRFMLEINVDYVLTTRLWRRGHQVRKIWRPGQDECV